MAYKTIQKLKEGYTNHKNLHEGKDGMIIGDNDGIQARHLEYSEPLLNPSTQNNELETKDDMVNEM
jgi:hypothetical protein